MRKVGRNDPCPCGSGKKYKQCCYEKEAIQSEQAVSQDAPVANIQDAVDAGLAHHQAGRLDKAQAIYEQILQTAPNHPDALHLSGMIAHQTGNNDIAVSLIGRAIRANPSSPMYCNLGLVLQAQGKLDAAVENYREALVLTPAYIAAHYNLGLLYQTRGHLDAAAESYRTAISLAPDHAGAHYNLALVFQAQGKLDVAITHYQAALAINPNFAEALCNLGFALYSQGKRDAALKYYHAALALKPNFIEAQNNLGNCLKDQGKLDAAAARYREALSINPDFAEAHSNLGVVQYGLGQLKEAVASYRRALEIKPDYAQAYCNLGDALQRLAQPDEAIASYRKALEVEPSYAEAHYGLANTFQILNRFHDAVESYRQALVVKPDFFEAHSNLGIAQQSLGRTVEAVTSYRRALEINPDYAEAHYNLGNAFLSQGQLDDAVASYRRALRLNRDHAEAHNNLGIALQDFGRIDDAAASYRRAIEINPDYTDARNNLLFTLNYHPDMSGEEIFAAYRDFNKWIEVRYRPEERPHNNSRDIKRRLKLGYISPDFRRHAVRHFLEPLLANHDKDAFEIYAYADLREEDSVTQRYKEYAEHWISTTGVSDAALAERIRADGIDILIDLAGHTAKNRLEVFARKPAPVSLSWLGYGYTTGLTAIDYLLTDFISAPAGSEHLYSEIPWRLETTNYVYRPAEDMGPVNSLPVAQNGHVTFGTLTRAVRINDRMIRAWSEILRRVENSRLVIDSGSFRDAAMQSALARKFAEHGIARDRLEIGCHSPPWDVLRGLDIALDCFPHNSGTTLFESLYMGLPFITLSGRPSVGRIGSSLLTAVGHPEWVAETEDGYVEKAVALASDLTTLAAVRAGLRTEMETSPLMDEAGFARKVEQAYRGMFESWSNNNR